MQERHLKIDLGWETFLEYVFQTLGARINREKEPSGIGHSDLKRFQHAVGGDEKVKSERT